MARMRIRDIAEEAGVSPATVSRFLNKRYGSMSEATRARVAEVVERTGYRPSAAARSLRLERSHALGIVLADIRNPYSAAMLEEVSDEAGSRGYAVMCAVSGNDAAKEAESVARLLDAGVDGLVVNSCGGNDAALAEADDRVPVVLLDRDLEDAETQLDLVTSDNETLMAELVAKVAEGGCTWLHLLTEADSTSSTRRERAATFMREVAARGLAGSVLALPAGPEEAARMVTQLAEGREPLGLIAVNGLVFQQVVEAVTLSGLEVPGQLRIATFDEYPWNRVLFGGVTTAAQDTRAIARAVVGRLCDRIEGGAADEATVRLELPGHVIARASTLG